MHGGETWAPRKNDYELLGRKYMRMPRRRMEIKRIYKIEKEEIRERAGAANMCDSEMVRTRTHSGSRNVLGLLCQTVLS